MLDWLSDKHNSIMGIATGLISSLFNCYFVPRRVFSPTAVPVLESWFYQTLPLFSFMLHSFLPYHVGDNFWHARYGFGAGLGVSAVLAGAFLTCLDCYPMYLK